VGWKVGGCIIENGGYREWPTSGRGQFLFPPRLVCLSLSLSLSLSPPRRFVNFSDLPVLASAWPTGTINYFPQRCYGLAFQRGAVGLLDGFVCGPPIYFQPLPHD
jgi:hypothetical protein